MEKTSESNQYEPNFFNILTFSKKVNYNGIPEFLDKLVENGKLITSMLYDFINNEYPKVPWKTVVALVGMVFVSVYPTSGKWQKLYL